MVNAQATHCIVVIPLLILAWASVARTQESGKSICVAGIVLKWVRGDKEANFRRAESMIREAAKAGAKLVCTTECFLDGYAVADKSISLEAYRDLGEPIPSGPYFQRLSSLTDELDIYLVAGLLEADSGERFNTAVLIGPDGKLIGKYHKQILGHESDRNSPGSDSLVLKTEFGIVGIMICADRSSPQIVRTLSSKGATLLLCPSGGNFGTTNDEVVRARSRENQRTIVFVHPAEFLVTDSDGKILKRRVLGNHLLIEPDIVGSERDLNRVVYCNIALDDDVPSRSMQE